ncbi:MAG: glycosyltransferase [Pedosphaera sp.]|nr:glycosyltransferase [Pedosphaera sp.]
MEYEETVLQDDSTPAPQPHRVALVTGGLLMGGSSTFVLNLAGELARRNVPAGVFCFERENDLAADFRAVNVPVFSFDGRALIFEDKLARVLGAVREFRPTVVLANIGTPSFEVLRYLPRGVFRCGIVHADLPSVYDSLRRYAPVLDAMAVVSQLIREKVHALPEFARVAVPYLPLGVPMPAQLPPRVFTGPLRVLYLGRLAREQKRVHLFPQILADLRRSGVPFHWTIAGEGPEGGWLRGNLGSGGPGQTVTFRGPVAFADVPELMSEHDVFLLASDYEGLPLTMLEAMGSGVVPVVSDLPSGVRDVVDENNGWRVAPENVAGYSEAIIALHGDRKGMAALSAAARQKVYPHFALAGMGDRWLGSFPAGAGAWEPWPERFQIRAPLWVANGSRYQPAGRMFRRWMKRLRPDRDYYANISS